MKILLAEEQTENIHKVKTSDVPTHAYDPYLMMLQCFSDGELYVGPIKNVGDVESFDMLIVPFPETNISHLANSKVLKVFLQMEPCITKYIEGVDSLNEMLINLSTYDVRIAYNLYEKRFICSFLDCFHVKPPCIPNDFSTSDEVEWDVCVGTRVGIGGVRYHG